MYLSAAVTAALAFPGLSPSSIPPAALCARLTPVVRRVVAARLPNDDEIEDSIHEALIQILRNIDHLRDLSALEFWSERIANNVVNTVIRKRVRFRKHVAAYVLASDDAYQPDWVGTSYLRHVVDVMSRMPPSEALVLYENWFEPLTCQERAARARCSASKVTRGLRRAQARFRTLALRDPYLSKLLGEAQAVREREERDQRT